MERRQFTAALFGPGLAGCLPGSAWALAEADAAAAVREALKRAAGTAVGLLGKTDGFLANDKVRIGLPPALARAGEVMKKLGQGKRVDELVTGMNRAAEQAVPLARPLLEDAVRKMSVEDAIGLVRGSDSAVTDFFSRKTRQPLAAAFTPVVEPVTQRLALARQYDEVVGRASKLGLVQDAPKKVHQHVTEKALDGVFLMLAEEERKLRADPAAAATALLKRVFGR